MNNKKAVLVVDDDGPLASMLKKGFLLKGYRCEEVQSGEAALEVLSRGTFDFMVTDVVMPGMNGFELTEKVRRAYPNMKIIIMTGFSQEDSLAKAVNAGAADFIKKPFTFRELVDKIEVL